MISTACIDAKSEEGWLDPSLLDAFFLFFFLKVSTEKHAVVDVDRLLHFGQRPSNDFQVD